MHPIPLILIFGLAAAVIVATAFFLCWLAAVVGLPQPEGRHPELDASGNLPGELPEDCRIGHGGAELDARQVFGGTEGGK